MLYSYPTIYFCLTFSSVIHWGKLMTSINKTFSIQVLLKLLNVAVFWKCLVCHYQCIEKVTDPYYLQNSHHLVAQSIHFIPKAFHENTVHVYMYNIYLSCS